MGFHVDPYGQPFTPRMGIEHALTYVGELSMFVTAWPIPSMLLVVTSVWLAAAVPSSRRWDLLLLGHFLLQLSVHAIYWGRGEFLGPRFLFTALPTLIVFIGRLPGTIIARAASIGSLHRRAIPAAVAMAFVGCLVLAWSAPASWLGVQGLMRIAAQSRQALRANVAGAVRAAGIGTSGDRALMFLREPFGARLTRRIWGIGVSRGETARLLATHDACGLHDMVLRLETDPTVPDTSAVSLLQEAPRFVPGEAAMQSTDGTLRLNGPASLTPLCRAEFDADTSGGFVAFGVGLPLEPIDAAGRIDGPVVYVADLGPLNVRLRARFGDRPWYRAVSREGTVMLERMTH